MVNRPSIVLADEPTGNLDTKATKVIMAALQEIHNAGNTIIMVTHNPDLAAYADRVITMVDGKIEDEFTGEQLAAELKSQKAEAEQKAEPAANNAIEPQQKKKQRKNKKHHSPHFFLLPNLSHTPQSLTLFRSRLAMM